MKNSAVVNGMTLTREQAEVALAEMNAPEVKCVTYSDRSASIRPNEVAPYSSGVCVRTGGSMTGKSLYLTPFTEKSEAITWTVETDDRGVTILVGRYTELV